MSKVLAVCAAVFILGCSADNPSVKERIKTLENNYRELKSEKTE
jgi:hypothetical protein